MGFGKTGLAVKLAEAYLQQTILTNSKDFVSKVFVIAPCSLVENFHVNIRKYGRSNQHIENYYDCWNFQQCLHHPDSAIKMAEKRMVVIDECHMARTWIRFAKKSTRKKTSGKDVLFHGRRVMEGRQAAVILQCARNASKLLLLSGTLIVNEIADLINIGYMLTNEPDLYFEHVMQSSSVRKALNQGLFTSAEVFRLIDQAFSLKLSYAYFQASIMSKMPTCTKISVLIEMNDDYYQSYREVMLAEEQKLLERGEKEITSTGAFFSGLRRICNTFHGSKVAKSQKLHFVIQLVMHAFSNRTKGVIASSFLSRGVKFVAKSLAKLEIPFAFVTGEQTPADRHASVEAYNQNQLTVLLLSTAGSTGIDLHGSSFHVNLDPTWTKAAEEQSNGRTVRFNSHVGLSFSHVMIFNLYMCKPGGELRLFEKRMNEAKTNEEPGASDVVMTFEATQPSTLKEPDDMPSIDLHLWLLQMSKNAKNTAFLDKYFERWAI